VQSGFLIRQPECRLLHQASLKERNNHQIEAMKKVAFFSLLFSLFIFHIHCNKEDETWGALSAVKDGVAWKAKSYCRDSNLDNQLLDFTSIFLSTGGALQEDISFISVPKKTGVYKLASFDPATYGGSGRKQCTAVYGTIVRGDLAEGLWTAAPDDTISYLEITRISEKTLKGKFAATFLLTANSKMHYPYLKDSVVFTDGYFFTEIKED
jgi:hypothetical protein